MKRNQANPAYLVQTPSAYCFRLRVPADLQNIVGLKELRYSLRTGSIRSAKRKARLVAGQVQMLFQWLKNGGALMEKLSSSRIRELIAYYVRSSIENWDQPLIQEEYLKKHGRPAPLNTPEEFRQQLELLAEIREHLVEEVSLSGCDSLSGDVEQLLKEHGLEGISPDSKEYHLLCYELYKAEIQLISLQIRHMKGDYSYKNELAGIFPELSFPAVVPAKQIIASQPTETLAMVAETYWSEKKGSWKPRTLTDYRICKRKVLEYFGENTPIIAIGIREARAFKAFLKEMENKQGRAISAARINIYLGFASAIFNYAKRNRYVSDNPFEGLQIPDKARRADEQRDVFTPEDLEKMFCRSREYSQDAHLWPHTFWIPLLGLFTGCRLEEICQLCVEDIRQEAGIWVLDINENKTEKSVKTNKRRLVPLHPLLHDELRFVEYVRRVPNAEGRVFSRLNRVNDRFGHGVGQWFARFRKRCGIEAEPLKKTFHSFRHTVINHLKQKGIAEQYIAELVGHQIKSITMSRYGKRYEPQILLEQAVLKLDYGIDLGHLKSSKYVPR